MRDIRVECRVDDFSFTVELKDGARPACRSFEDRWFPLAMALDVVALEELLDLVEARSAYSREETVGFAYAEASPEDVPEGKVRVFLAEDELFLDRTFFESAVVEYGIAALGCLRQAGRPASDGTAKRLWALRGRVREHGDGRIVALKRRVDGLDFIVEVARDGWVEALRADGEWWTVGAALATLWRDSPQEFVVLLETGGRAERKDYYRFTYDGEAVEIYVPETSSSLPRKGFEALAAELGLAVIEGARLLGRETPQGLEARLRAVRARI